MSIISGQARAAATSSRLPALSRPEATGRARRRLSSVDTDVLKSTAATGGHDQVRSEAHDVVLAVTSLYQAHSVEFLRLAVVMLGDRMAAEDVVQEAFCALYRRWHHLDDRGKALSYVRSALLNGCRSQLRARIRAQRRPRTRPRARSPKEAPRRCGSPSSAPASGCPARGDVR